MNKIAEARLAKSKLDEIIYFCRTGEISYEEAKKQAAKPLNSFNEGMAEISRAHGFKPKRVSFSQLMR